MRTETLTLQHQSILEPRLKKLGLNLSEYAFSNVYLFRNFHKTRIMYGEDVYLSGVTRKGESFCTPLTPVNDLKIGEIKGLLKDFDFFYPVPEDWLPFFHSKGFRSFYDEGDSDYLFTSQKLKSYPGRHLSSRRNLLKQFKEIYPNHHSFPLDKNNLSDALVVLENWQTGHSFNPILSDYEACKEALQLFDVLKIEGHVTYVEEGKPGGFVLGQSLNEQTFAFLFAKGLKGYKGIYQYLYSEFANSVENKCQFINLEQDLGSAELAHAKRAYHPDELLRKHRLQI